MTLKVGDIVRLKYSIKSGGQIYPSDDLTISKIKEDGSVYLKANRLVSSVAFKPDSNGTLSYTSRETWNSTTYEIISVEESNLALVKIKNTSEINAKYKSVTEQTTLNERKAIIELLENMRGN